MSRADVEQISDGIVGVCNPPCAAAARHVCGQAPLLPPDLQQIHLHPATPSILRHVVDRPPGLGLAVLCVIYQSIDMHFVVTSPQQGGSSLLDTIFELYVTG